MIQLVSMSAINGAGGLPCARVKINGKRMLALVDTGAAFSCANVASAIEIDPTVRLATSAHLVKRSTNQTLLFNETGDE
jgi:predicted aspartyl protease